MSEDDAEEIPVAANPTPLTDEEIEDRARELLSRALDIDAQLKDAKHLAPSQQLETWTHRAKQARAAYLELHQACVSMRRFRNEGRQRYIDDLKARLSASDQRRGADQREMRQLRHELLTAQQQLDGLNRKLEAVRHTLETRQAERDAFRALSLKLETELKTYRRSEHEDQTESG